MNLLLCIFLALCLLAWRAKWDDRPTLWCLVLVVSYYCVGGAWYWSYVQDGTFLGAHWGSELVFFTASALAFSTLVWAGGISAYSKFAGLSWDERASSRRGYDGIEKLETPLSRPFWIMLWLGLASLLFVMRFSSFAVSDFDIHSTGSLFLIAFQFSDMLVPLIIYMVGRRGYDRYVILLILIFVVYAVLTGLRYKLALLFLPLLWDAIASKRSLFFKGTVMILLGLGSLVLFSAMTLYRVKFGIPDLTTPLRGDPFTQALWGMFADSNILFGQISIQATYADRLDLYPFQPVIDSITQFMPHFLFPNRITMGYALNVYYGFGTTAGAYSGTAWPWLAEFMIMVGWPAILLAPLVMLLVYVFFKSLLLGNAVTRRQYMMGTALIAAGLAYFQFSRGPLPMNVKNYIFVILPYMYLCRVDKLRLLAPVQPHPAAQPAPAE